MIEMVPSQYATDLQKCILRVEEYEEKGGIDEMDLIILGGLSGRLDQTMHTLHVLCQMTLSDGQQADKVSSSEKRRQLEQDDFAVLDRRRRTWVLSENSLVCVLGKVSASRTGKGKGGVVLTPFCRARTSSSWTSPAMARPAV